MSPGPTPTQRLARLTGLGRPGGGAAARTPFALLIVLLLAGGMLCLLFLNASLNEGSFEQSELRRETRELTDEQQELQAEVDGYADPDALAERARELGMVPAGPPAFLGPDGTLLGDASPSPAAEPEPEPQLGEGPREATGSAAARRPGEGGERDEPGESGPPAPAPAADGTAAAATPATPSAPAETPAGDAP